LPEVLMIFKSALLTVVKLLTQQHEPNFDQGSPRQKNFLSVYFYVNVNLKEFAQ
jgi:hypothetical protein